MIIPSRRGGVKGGVESREGWSQGRGGVKGGVQSREGWSQGRGAVKGGVESREGWSQGRGAVKGGVETMPIPRGRGKVSCQSPGGGGGATVDYAYHLSQDFDSTRQVAVLDRWLY